MDRVDSLEARVTRHDDEIRDLTVKVSQFIGAAKLLAGIVGASSLVQLVIALFHSK